ncbi:putative MFS family arabinose efflux permease [Paenibacillus forsythiae]|uniref:MFS family arabinose efflux permease n=1 Tax=Paenibacillus forsythiae TaxID=365616 RepID=A0ABU3H8G8_9BACL|nr:MFS transporter [Paenibacillus forsythiae]MDT3427122.1 putative MFS family arabinose efflux permease [Paenibacillus forsythiae]
MKKRLSIYIIALGVFGIVNTELGVVGILPQISDRFNVSASQAGMLVSMFALIIALSGPFATLLFSGINRKTILGLVVVVFAISNLVSAFSSTYSVLMLCRVFPAFLHPVYFSVAFAAAASSVPKEQSAAAVAKVFTGLTVGMVLGVPITSFIGDRYSLEVAFLFSSIINMITYIGIVIWIPSMPVEEKLTYGKQLRIMLKPQLWMNIAATCFILAALYSLYSYFAEYLIDVTNMSSRTISFMLVIFGASGIFGNLCAGKFLSKNITATISVYLVLLGTIYLLIFYTGKYMFPMILIIIVWGAVFAGGLLIGQTWLTSEALEAPEFANSLFVSFANLGVVFGTAVGGWFLARMGTHSIVWSGILFLMLASVCIGVKIRLFDFKESKFNCRY